MEAEPQAIDAPQLHLCIRNSVEELQVCAARVLEFLQAEQVDRRAAYRIDLVLEELIGNTLRYGYADSASHAIDVAVCVEPDVVRLTIEDDAGEFNPLDMQPAHTVHPQAVGGRGLKLVKALVARSEYQRTGRRNRVTLRIARAGKEI